MTLCIFRILLDSTRPWPQPTPCSIVIIAHPLFRVSHSLLGDVVPLTLSTLPTHYDPFLDPADGDEAGNQIVDMDPFDLLLEVQRRLLQGCSSIPFALHYATLALPL